MSNNCKVKGLLRGLRFISQIFDNDTEEEIQIGHPTDVKHVAHIGWQGPSESSPPSWMNGFKSAPGLSSSAPLHLNGEIHSDGPDDSVKWVSEDSIRRGSRSVNSQGQERDLPDLPKSSRRQLMGNMRESHAKEKSDRPRQHKKSSKHSHQQKDHTTTCNVSKPTEETMATDITDSLQLQGSDLQQPRTLTDNHRRSRSNRTRDGSNGGSGGSSGSRSRAKPRDLNLDQEHPSRSSSTSRNKQRSFEGEEDEPLQRRSSKQLVTN